MKALNLLENRVFLGASVVSLGLLGLAGLGCTQALTPSASSQTQVSSLNSDQKPASAVTITWAGHVWNVTDGGMAGHNTGSSANVFVDANGYLHLKIAKPSKQWTCAELFTQDNLGFGTYKWVIEGAIDKLDKNVVLGLFPYGPAAGIGGDGTNEIDIEYSRWGTTTLNNAWYTVYPASGNTQGKYNFWLTLPTTTPILSTSQFTWSSTGVSYKTLDGAGNVLGSFDYFPTNPTTNIPQQALPLGINLWLYRGKAPAAPQEVIIRSFTKS